MIKFVSILMFLALSSCGASAPVPVTPGEVRTALCVAKAVHDAGDVRALSPEELVQLAGALRACAGNGADAGVSR